MSENFNLTLKSDKFVLPIGGRFHMFGCFKGTRRKTLEEISFLTILLYILVINT